MAQDLWSIRNAVDGAQLSVDGTIVPDYGPQRLTDPRLGAVWRPSAPGDGVTIRFSENRPIDVIVAYGPALAPGDLFQLRIGSSVGASDIRSGVWAPAINAEINMAVWIAERDAPGVDASSVAEIELTTPTTALRDIGRVWAGAAAWRPETGHIYGAEQTFVDTSLRVIGPRSGAVFSSPGARLREHRLTYDAITPDEWSGPSLEVARYTGISRQLLFVPDHEVYPPEAHALIGYQIEINPIIALGFRRFERAFHLREAG